MSGKISQVIGPVLDIHFPDGNLPELNNAVEINGPDGVITAEVLQHIGNDTVRCVSLSPTEGLVRGVEAVDTGGPVTVPVGEEVLGRVFNVLGKVIDKKEEVNGKERWAIHRSPPSFAEQRAVTEVLETGIKVIDL
ncbi:MAG: F0F1 ATP synthase subunit beta, partial [Treponema sp.]|nr:F0F1 ATP synthase subunit beta [Treponema sp.]